MLLFQTIPAAADAGNKTFTDKTSTQWYPILEWTVKNLSVDGNPFDLEAKAVFFHKKTGQTITTPLFYHGNSIWKFRFTGTRTGVWKVTTYSKDKDLNGWSGKIIISGNENADAHGFMKAFGNKWGWQGTESVFIPQYVMSKSPYAYLDDDKRINEEMIRNDVREFVTEHGFTGFHFSIMGKWFDGENPDTLLYAVLEKFIMQIHKKGGACHIWMWGADIRNRGTGPEAIAGGPMSPMDRRNLRYLAARLGPLPGWSLSYGVDTEEGWVLPEEYDAWKEYIEMHSGWDHIIGARVGYDPGGRFRVSPSPPRPPTDAMRRTPAADKYIVWDGGDYTGYTGFRPLYPRYTEVLQHRPEIPSFEEDRFRLRMKERYNSKDYTPEFTRRGLWHSAMAGGVANIWGNLVPHNQNDLGSEPYNNREMMQLGADSATVNIKEQIGTYSRFFKNRFLKEMVSFFDGPEMRLIIPHGKHAIIYREDCNLVRLQLQDMNGEQPAIAVDARKPYKEIELGNYSPGVQTWQAPYRSDWAVAIGDF